MKRLPETQVALSILLNIFETVKYLKTLRVKGFYPVDNNSGTFPLLILLKKKSRLKSKVNQYLCRTNLLDYTN